MRIDIEGTYNIRDLGGIPAAGGMRVMPGALFRGDALWTVTEKGISQLADLGVRRVIDLRTINEVREKPDREIPGSEYIHLSLLSVPEKGISREEGGQSKDIARIFIDSVLEMGMDVPGNVNRMYEDILSSKYSVNAVKKFFELLLDGEKGAVFWHCTAGKDRTGIVTVLLLGLLGAPRDEIIKDYRLSDTYLLPHTEMVLAAVSKVNSDPELLRQVRILNSVLPEYVERVFSIIDSGGGIERFAESVIGIPRDAVTDLRKLYLTD